ncbi:MAG: HAD-IA family hydrolase [Clostridia bacterium]|nr:HAD-IA family hydrolase [Clostridia bacterium]
MIRVSAGIIRRADGCILICRRGENRGNAGLWEFPGGKQESGESAAACLRRELQEELSLPVTEPALLCTREAQGIIFDFLTCETAAEPVLTEHASCAWVRPRAMLGYDFCPADTGVARALALQDPPLRHFMWDFDGTLMDTYPAMVAAFLAACRRFGEEVDPAYALTLMKDNLTHCIRTVADERGMDFDALTAAYREEENAVPDDAVPPLPSIPEVLRALHAAGGRHYLVTHRDSRAWDFLRAAGLRELFEGGVVKEDRLPRKPEPDMVQAILDRFGIDPAEAVMIGDRPLDTAAGRAAGVLSLMLDPDRRFPGDPAELRCENAQELVPLLTGTL